MAELQEIFGIKNLSGISNKKHPNKRHTYLEKTALVQMCVHSKQPLIFPYKLKV